MKIEKYILPEKWASPLINNNYTGMTEGEEKELKKWLLENENDLAGGHWGNIEPAGYRKFHDARSVMDVAAECAVFDRVFLK